MDAPEDRVMDIDAGGDAGFTPLKNTLETNGDVLMNGVSLNSSSDLTLNSNELTSGSLPLTNSDIDMRSCESPENDTSTPKLQSTRSQEEVSDEDWMLILGHDKLKKRVIRKGEGFTSRPQQGQLVTISYSGRLDDGTVVDKCDKQTLTVADGDIIQALDLCIALMELHETCEIVTDAQYAYGTKGREPDIPGNARLTYIAELHSVDESPDYSTWPITARVEEATRKRERGNTLYSSGDYSSAINSYTKALNILDEGNEAGLRGNAEDLQSLFDCRIACYNNLAAAQLKVAAFDAAIKSCDQVLKSQPENVKALFRKGKCLAGKGELDDAIQVLQKALKLEPQTKIIHQELAALRAKNKKQDQSQRDMYQRMFWGNEKRKQPKQMNSSWWLYIGGAAAAVLLSLSIAAYRYIHD